MAKVLMPLPDEGFDVTEVAVPWRALTDVGHRVVFATETGSVPAADPLLLRGVIFGKLGAEPEPKAFYARLTADDAFRAPLAWDDLELESFDGLVLAGGHAPGMRQYLGSPLAHVRTTCLPKYMERASHLATFWKLGRYHRTYPAYVEDEVRGALVSPGTQFVRGPFELSRRGTATDDAHAFVVEDGRYVSGRWPGDAYLFARRFLARLAP